MDYIAVVDIENFAVKWEIEELPLIQDEIKKTKIYEKTGEMNIKVDWIGLQNIRKQ